MSSLVLRAAADAGALALIALTGIGLVTMVPELRAHRLFARLGWAWLLGAAWLG